MGKHRADITHDEIFTEIKKYIVNKDSLDMIERAYQYSQKFHSEQIRKSGEPYFVHLQNVAYELAVLRSGPRTIAAGFLHDVCEDCDVSKEELAKEFGEEIAELVEAVTKIGNLEFKDEKEYQAANHRKIFIAMAKDIRVILIKLVDRLHNMRTLKFMSEVKQKKIAQETLDVYAPIAHRLGISEIKNELEDLSFFYLDKEEYYSIARQLEAKKNERDSQINEMIEEMSSILRKCNIKFRIFGRSKHIYSIHKKMESKNKRFAEILDLLAIRIITESELNCYEILGYIHAKYRPIPGRLKDYIAVPKMNMYQSLHTTILDNYGHFFEIQIRTEEMDSIADRGIAAHWHYKENTKYDAKKEQKEIEERLSWFKELITITEDYNNQNPKSYMDALTKDVFEANVYIMTPKGRVINLPNGSTPIDFAYRIHTEVGHNTIGAIVNDTMVPINTILKTGDVVELKTNKNSTPSEDWLKFVKTNHAKNKIKSFLTRKETELKQEQVKNGEQALKEELRKRGLSVEVYMKPKKIEQVFSTFQVTNYVEFMYIIATKQVSLQNVIEKLTTEKKVGIDLETITKNISKKKVSQYSNVGVSVSGIDSMKISLSNCCCPVFGDEICGLVSKGEGVKVHQLSCPNAKRDIKRHIEVYWNNDASKHKYGVNVKIKARNRNLLLSDIITCLGQYKANILEIKSSINNKDLSAETKVKVQVENFEHLRIVIANLAKIEDVNEVIRFIK